jgi:hypothetical protein
MSKRSRDGSGSGSKNVIITLDDADDEIVFLGSKRYVNSSKLSDSDGSNDISANNGSSSSSSSRIGYVACPLLNQSLPDGMINIHLDSCLGQKKTMIVNNLTIEGKTFFLKEAVSCKECGLFTTL